MVDTNYVPTDFDIKWTEKLLRSMNIGGVWAIPMSGQMFIKTGELELTYMPVGEQNIVVTEAEEDMLFKIAANLEAIGGELMLPDEVKSVISTEISLDGNYDE